MRRRREAAWSHDVRKPRPRRIAQAATAASQVGQCGGMIRPQSVGLLEFPCRVERSVEAGQCDTVGEMRRRRGDIVCYAVVTVRRRAVV